VPAQALGAQRVVSHVHAAKDGLRAERAILVNLWVCTIDIMGGMLLSKQLLTSHPGMRCQHSSAVVSCQAWGLSCSLQLGAPTQAGYDFGAGCPVP
jgi:hypothetical protein